MRSDFQLRVWLSVASIALLVGAMVACDDDGTTGTTDAADVVIDTPMDHGEPDGGDVDDDVQPDLQPDVELDAMEDADSPSIGETVTVPVGGVFPTGTAVRDGYGGARGVVSDDGTVTIVAHPNGLLLLERDAMPGPEAEFSWDNATVYFVIPDRFENGDPSNDNSYGRQAAEGEVVGTFHGGDLAGLTERIDYLDALGVNAIWITPPYEQVHGYVGGGSGGFQHFPYHGYWALDYTRLDANMGTEDDLRAFIGEAHDRGIRVIFDVVMNHPGYGTMADLDAYLPEVLSGEWESWTPGEGQNWHSWNDLFVDFTSTDWTNWWGPEWIRADLPGYDSPGFDDLTRTLNFLPDFKTESTTVLTSLPVLLQRKDDTEAEVIAGATVRDYLVTWLADWVREYGVDGFRCDTAKHVELAAWNELKQAADAALDEWRAANPDEALDDLDFWMTGEVFPHDVVKDAYFTEGGFDSLINFYFQGRVRGALDDYSELEAIYSEYAGAINTDPELNVLSYISSHDTHLFFQQHGRDVALQEAVGTALLLVPGGVQIFYGDETGRRAGPNGGDPKQGTRSDMNWDSHDEDLLRHWQRVGRFRNRHVAVGAGSHREITFDGGYAFAREYSAGDVEDAVVVVLFDP